MDLLMRWLDLKSKRARIDALRARVKWMFEK